MLTNVYFGFFYIILYFTAVCNFTQEQYRDIFGYEQIQLIGYVEKDGNIGITQENERVIIGSTIEEGIVVFVGCSNW